MCSVSGVVESLNYGAGPGSPYLAGMAYSICWRRAAPYCGLQLSAPPGGFILNSNGLAEEGRECHSPHNSSLPASASNDFLQLLGGFTLSGGRKLLQAFYCGGDNSTAIPPIRGQTAANKRLTDRPQKRYYVQ